MDENHTNGGTINANTILKYNSKGIKWILKVFEEFQTYKRWKRSPAIILNEKLNFTFNTTNVSILTRKDDQLRFVKSNMKQTQTSRQLKSGNLPEEVNVLVYQINGHHGIYLNMLFNCPLIESIG